jgi:hypothetical protein
VTNWVLVVAAQSLCSRVKAENFAITGDKQMLKLPATTKATKRATTAFTSCFQKMLGPRKRHPPKPTSNHAPVKPAMVLPLAKVCFAHLSVAGLA